MGSQLVMDDIYRRFQCSGLDDAHTICSRKAHDTYTNTNTQTNEYTNTQIPKCSGLTDARYFLGKLMTQK